VCAFGMFSFNIVFVCFLGFPLSSISYSLCTTRDGRFSNSWHSLHWEFSFFFFVFEAALDVLSARHTDSAPDYGVYKCLSGWLWVL